MINLGFTKKFDNMRDALDFIDDVIDRHRYWTFRGSSTYGGNGNYTAHVSFDKEVNGTVSVLESNGESDLFDPSTSF